MHVKPVFSEPSHSGTFEVEITVFMGSTHSNHKGEGLKIHQVHHLKIYSPKKLGEYDMS